jgi:hypothetical protein
MQSTCLGDHSGHAPINVDIKVRRLEAEFRGSVPTYPRYPQPISKSILGRFSVGFS